jgi:hypothetical protein
VIVHLRGKEKSKEQKILAAGEMKESAGLSEQRRVAIVRGGRGAFNGCKRLKAAPEDGGLERMLFAREVKGNSQETSVRVARGNSAHLSARLKRAIKDDGESSSNVTKRGRHSDPIEAAHFGYGRPGWRQSPMRPSLDFLVGETSQGNIDHRANWSIRRCE